VLESGLCISTYCTPSSPWSSICIIYMYGSEDWESRVSTVV